MTAREILNEGIRKFIDNPDFATTKNIYNLRIAAALTWQREEMGGVEHLGFAYRNNTPIVPPGHCGHPTELVKRGYIDGEGWPKEKKEPKINIFRWPTGKHYYPTVDNEAVVENGIEKWNTVQAAEAAAQRFISSKKPPKQK